MEDIQCSWSPECSVEGWRERYKSKTGKREARVRPRTTKHSSDSELVDWDVTVFCFNPANWSQTFTFDGLKNSNILIHI